MAERHWEVGICGTFDVANYGDLLFPLIAESELAQRLGAVTLHRFSYHARTPPEWPYQVTSVTALPQMIDKLDGLLIGGGHVIRFDKQVAPGYGPPTPEIHHPTGYWLTPAFIALQNDVPVVWNAPGTGGDDIPAWARPLVETVLKLSPYVSVRDLQSRLAIEPLAGASVAVVPDTAFGLPRLLNLEGTPSAEFRRLSQACHLEGPYIVIQATFGMEGIVRFLRKHSERLRDFRFLALPIGPVHGDRQELIDGDLKGVVRLAEWPSPLVVAELIGRSVAVVGRSYHLALTALVSGVPVFTPLARFEGKYLALRHFEPIFGLPPDREIDPEWFLARVGRAAPCPSARATVEPLACHWDRIAAVLQADRVPTAPALSRFWQSLPALLEDAATPESDLATQLTAARAEVAAGNVRVADIKASASWRLTAPVRFVGRWFPKERKRPLIDLDRIREHRLETDPYRWAAIPNLFKPEDAATLTATYPCDHFKLVATHGGEREYEYEARSLIGMGRDAIEHPHDLSDAWRALAADLLSPEYRAAMTNLTGCDLTRAPMEVNVFHYGPGGSLSPHRDLPERIVTHVLYFNARWNRADGGCLSILGSADPEDLVAEIPPIVGNSSVIVRSENSWHAVSRVASNSARSRRSVTVTFYRTGSVSTMWPPGDATPLHRYHAADLA